MNTLPEVSFFVPVVGLLGVTSCGRGTAVASTGSLLSVPVELDIAVRCVGIARVSSVSVSLVGVPRAFLLLLVSATAVQLA